MEASRLNAASSSVSTGTKSVDTVGPSLVFWISMEKVSAVVACPSLATTLMDRFPTSPFSGVPEKVAADTSKLVLSPMPGLVVDIPVAVGQEVKTGETVAIIEALKMQNILKAERDGVVKAVSVRAGDPVAADDVLVEFG